MIDNAETNDEHCNVWLERLDGLEAVVFEFDNGARLNFMEQRDGVSLRPGEAGIVRHARGKSLVRIESILRTLKRRDGGLMVFLHPIDYATMKATCSVGSVLQ